MKLKATALALCVASSSLTAVATNSICKEPITFYNDCEFKEKSSAVGIDKDNTLTTIAKAPKAVNVPAGCRVTLFSATSTIHSANKPSHGMFIKGPKKLCVAKHHMVPVALEIKHDTDSAVIVNDIETLQGRNSALQDKLNSLESALGSLQTQVESGALRGPTGAQGLPGIEGRQGIRGATGKGEPGKDGVGATGSPGRPGKDGRDGRPGKDGIGAIGKAGPKGERGETGRPGLRGPTGMQGAQGEQGAAGLGLHLKIFKIGNSYKKGDYVFVKGTTQDVMYVAERDFVAKKAPADESANWVSFKAPAGPKGARGDNGAAGKDGESGARGDKGAPGTPGSNGKAGENGKNGENGIDGAPGKPGKASKGEKGDQGPPGKKGPTGPAGKDAPTPPKCPTFTPPRCKEGEDLSTKPHPDIPNCKLAFCKPAPKPEPKEPVHKKLTTCGKKWSTELDYPTVLKFELMGAGGSEGGDRSHGNNVGGSGAKVSGSVYVPSGKTVDVYVGCRGTTRRGRIGGGGGGSSAIVVDGKVVVISGGGGGGAGVGSAPGGNAGRVGSSGGRDQCRGSGGGGGGSQTSGGNGGGGNRGKPNGRKGGDDGTGGNAGQTNGAPGGWGFKNGGHSANNPGDGGGGGGGAGYRGGGGGGTGCHGSAGGGGSSFTANNVQKAMFTVANNKNGNGKADLTFEHFLELRDIPHVMRL